MADKREMTERAALVLAAVAALAVMASAAHGQFALADFYPTDGTFQNFNPFRRLDGGQVPFRDFTVYLGFAPALLGWLPYRILGGTYAASAAALYALHLLIGMGCMAALARLAGLRPRLAAMAGPTFIGFAMATANVWRFPLLENLLDPESSQMGVRAALPVLVAWLVWRLAGADRKPSVGLAAVGAPRRMAVLGALAGLAPLWSNDFGLPTLLGMFVLAGLCLAPRRAVERLVGATAFLFAAAGSFWIAAALITGGRPSGWMEENFGALASAQYWYFVVAPERKVFSLAGLPRAPWMIAEMACCAVLLAAYAKRRRAADALLAFVGLTALLAGYLGWVAGMPLERYFAAALETFLVVGPASLAALARLVGWPKAPPSWGSLSWSERWSVACGGLCLVALIASARAWPAPPDAVYVPELGGSLSPGYMPAIDVARALKKTFDAAHVPADRRVFSTYSTAFDVVAGARQPTRQDYVIHRFGDASRAAYVRALVEDKIPYATTPRPGIVAWEPWVVRANWDVYKELFLRYAPLEDAAYARIWRLRETPLAPIGTKLSCAATPTPWGARLRVSDAGGVLPAWSWVDVALRYRVALRKTWIPVIGTRALLAARPPSTVIHENALPPGMSFTLPADKDAWSFPVLHRRGVPSALNLDVYPVDRARLTVAGCDATAWVSAASLRPQMEPTNVPLRVAVAVASSKAEAESFAPGRVLLHVSGPGFYGTVLPGQIVDGACLGRREVLGADLKDVLFVSGGLTSDEKSCLAEKPSLRLLSSPDPND